jgi:hypothetical protein
MIEPKTAEAMERILAAFTRQASDVEDISYLYYLRALVEQSISKSITQLHDNGVSYYAMAKATPVTRRAMMLQLERWKTLDRQERQTYGTGANHQDQPDE